ncbi:hypothetical protein ACB098_06G230400 [Castanea mollissima]
MDEPLLSEKQEIVEEKPSRPSSQHQLPSQNNHQDSDVNLIANLSNKMKMGLRRGDSLPKYLIGLRENNAKVNPPEPQASSPTIVPLAFVGVILYVIIVVTIFMTSGSFRGHTTFKPVDALYFTVVTLCTVGYGDIVPDSTFTKLFTCFYIIVGFVIFEFLLNSFVTHICNKQEEVLLSSVDENKYKNLFHSYMIDTKKGRVRIRTKVGLASGVVIGCIAIGTITVHFVEGMSWVDGFYLSITSVTTVGYGDYAFTTIEGRCFAIIWLLVSTLAVAKAFLYLTELRIERRNRRFAQWILHKKITARDLVAADLDHDGTISKAEFIIYKLTMMRRITQRETLQIAKEFDLQDTRHFGKLTLNDILNMEAE